MMGLGIGLTPSADDYLTGLALILFISGHPAEKYKEEFYLGLQRGKNNTTLLSAITLEAALQQRCRENIHRFIHNIIYFRCKRNGLCGIKVFPNITDVNCGDNLIGAGGRKID